MKTFPRLMFASVSFAMLSTLHSAVVIDFNVDEVRTTAGVPVTQPALGFLVADTTGDGFGTIAAGNISVGDIVGSNDLIIFRADFSNFATDGVWSQTTGLLTLTGNWTASDNLAFVWFPTLSISSTSVGGGVSYGLLANAGVWVTPTDGSSTTDPYQIISTTNNGLFSSNNVTLSVTDSQSRASLTTAVPEPATWALLAGSLTTVMVFRRRRPQA